MNDNPSEQTLRVDELVDKPECAAVMKKVGRESDFSRLAKQKASWPPKIYERPKLGKTP